MTKLTECLYWVKIDAAWHFKKHHRRIRIRCRIFEILIFRKIFFKIIRPLGTIFRVDYCNLKLVSQSNLK